MDRGTPDPTTGLRPSVMAFARLMELKLAANDDAKPHWKQDGLSVTWAHLQREVVELFDSFESGTPRDMALEAADVGCLAMMIADITGGLYQPAPHP